MHEIRDSNCFAFFRTLDFDEEIDLATILEDKVIVDKTIFKEWVASFLDADKGYRERMFIIQVAIEDGWTMAKGVALRKSGKYKDSEYQKEAEFLKK